MKVLPNGWDLLPLSELVHNPKSDIVDGPFGSNLKRSDFHSSGVPVLKIQNIKPNEIQLKKMDYVTPVKAASLERHSFVSGDIIMTKLGAPLGVSAIVGEDLPEGLIVADLVRIRPGNVNPRFLCYQLNSPGISKFLNDSQKGTTRPRINIQIVRNLPIAIPSIEEQARVVESLDIHLSRLDKALAELEQADHKTLVLRRSILKELLDPKESESGQRSDLMSEPTHAWKKTTLGAVASIQKGMTITAKSARPGTVPVIAGGQKPAYFHAQANRPAKTITVSASGAYAGYVAFHAEPIWASDCTTLVPTDEKLCTPEFLFYFMQSKQNEIYSLQRGSGMPHVYAKDIAQLEIGLPNLDEQNKIVKALDERLSYLESTRAYIIHQKSPLQTLRRSLLREAFIGKLGII
jgi:type I restriction enzyme S subunit